MMVDTRIYAYAFDGWVACPDCVDDGPYVVRSGAVYPNDDASIGRERQASAVFSHEDDGWGLQCDDCGADIFATSPEIEHREYGYHDEYTNAERDDADCDDCRSYLTAHDEHANDAWNDGPWTFEDWCEECADEAVSRADEHQRGEHNVGTFNQPAGCQHCAEQRAREALTASMWEDEA